jgi:hypothetical protein
MGATDQNGGEDWIDPVGGCVNGSVGVASEAAIEADMLFDAENWFETPAFGVSIEFFDGEDILGNPVPWQEFGGTFKISGINPNFDYIGALVFTAEDAMTDNNTDGFLYAAYQVDFSKAVNGMLEGSFANPFNDGVKTSNILTAQLYVTPVPAALPLIATGLAALGIVGARRRKAA